MTVRPQFEGEHVDSMLRRLKKRVQGAGLMGDVRRHSEHTSRGQRRRCNAKASRHRRNSVDRWVDSR
jgi:ribosomal protein S21